MQNFADQFTLGKWNALLSALFECSQSPSAAHRESAFRIFAAVPELISNQHNDTLKSVFMNSLTDVESQEVRMQTFEGRMRSEVLIVWFHCRFDWRLCELLQRTSAKLNRRLKRAWAHWCRKCWRLESAVTHDWNHMRQRINFISIDLNTRNQRPRRWQACRWSRCLDRSCRQCPQIVQTSFAKPAYCHGQHCQG